MNLHSVCCVLLATCACTWVVPALAEDAGSPETMRKVRADVALYYQAHPTMRAEAAWLVHNPATPTCAKPRFPKAMIKDELEGTTFLKYQVDALGKARNAVIARSSRWAVLDEAALEALTLCVLVAGDASEWHTVGYRFSMQ